MSEEKELIQVPESASGELELYIDWEGLSDGLTQVMQDWLPFLAFGVPYVEIARIFGINKSTITHQIQNHPEFARAIAMSRQMMKWQLHQVWLNQKAIAAWKNVDYFLNLDPLAKDEEGKYLEKDPVMRRSMMQERAKMTRFVLEQLGLRVQRVEVTHNTPNPMFQGDESLAAEFVSKLKDIIESGKDIRSPEDMAKEYRRILAESDSIDTEQTEEGTFVPIEEEEELEKTYKFNRASYEKRRGKGKAKSKDSQTDSGSSD